MFLRGPLLAGAVVLLLAFPALGQQQKSTPAQRAADEQRALLNQLDRAFSGRASSGT